jgi:hypothetical protein
MIIPISSESSIYIKNFNTVELRHEEAFARHSHINDNHVEFGVFDLLFFDVPQLNTLIFIEDEELLRLYCYNLDNRLCVFRICLDN